MTSCVKYSIVSQKYTTLFTFNYKSVLLKWRKGIFLQDQRSFIIRRANTNRRHVRSPVAKKEITSI